MLYKQCNRLSSNLLRMMSDTLFCFVLILVNIMYDIVLIFVNIGLEVFLQEQKASFLYITVSGHELFKARLHPNGVTV